MSERSVTHATFVIERRYPAAPARVFAAWASPEAKGRWFIGPDEWVSSGHTLDFRVGGRERVAGGPKGGSVHTFENTYHDIIENQRIVSTYDMYMDDRRTSVSLVTVEFHPDGAGTRMVYSEHGAFLDGLDDVASRKHGTEALLDALARDLERRPAR